MQIIQVLPAGEWMAVYVDADNGRISRIRLMGWCVYEDEGEIYSVGMLPAEEDGYMILATNPPPEDYLFIDYASSDEWEQEQHFYNQEGARLLAEHNAMETDTEEDEDGGEQPH